MPHFSVGMASLSEHILLNKKWYVSLYLLLSIHIIGCIGLLNGSTHALFVQCTPLSLIISALIVAWHHNDWNRSFALFGIATFFVGLIIEIIGVNTGFPFGFYEYFSGLGFKLFETPLLIGVNWVLLIYCTGMVAAKLTSSTPFRVLLASSLMVFIDFWMEPVAPHLQLWEFKGGTAPLQNYTGWFAVSLLLHAFFFRLKFQKKNSMAIVYVFIIVAFFISLYTCSRIQQP